MALKVVERSERRAEENQSAVPVAKTQIPRTQPRRDTLVPCESPHCAGCYDVGDGRKIHPPKIGEDYQKWLERWKAEGSVQ
jgi:hypothetical protein